MGLLSRKKNEAALTVADYQKQVEEAEAVLANAQSAVESADAAFVDSGDDVARAALKQARVVAEDATDDLARARKRLVQAEEAAAEAQRADLRRQIADVEGQLRDDSAEAKLVGEEVAALRALATARVKRRLIAIEKAELNVKLFWLEKRMIGGGDMNRSVPDSVGTVSWQPVADALAGAAADAEAGVASVLRGFANGIVGGPDERVRGS